MRQLSGPRGSGSRARRLQIEPLEDRKLLAITSLTVGSPMLYSDLAAADGGVDASILEVVNLTIQNGGSINANDNFAGSIPNDGASPPIVIQASGNVLIEADTNAGDDPTTGGTNTGIFAENRLSGGLGGNITMTVGGSLTMQSGATISSSDTLAEGNPNPSGSGDITIDVNGPIDMQAGAYISAGYFATNPGSGGAIDIKTQVGDIDIDGFVLSQSRLTGTSNQAPGGGTIFISAGVKDNLGSHLTIGDTGVVSSKGRDPGADLVHLQGCGVTIYGLVESTGAGHSLPTNPPNHLNGTFRPDKPANSTGGVEVWAGHSITIDSTGTHNGEINADIGITGGTQGVGWIDLFSRDGQIKIIGDATGPFAVHANGGLQQNTDAGGLVTIKATNSGIVASGLAIQADSTTAGSDGGVIVVEALQNINFNTATVSAQGDSNPTGGLGDGGTLNVRSFAGNITWTSGAGDVRPDGTINLTAFGTITLGATFAAGAPNQFNDISGGVPLLPLQTLPTDPTYVVLPLCEVDPTGSIEWEKRDQSNALQGGATFTVVNTGNTFSLTVTDNGLNDADPDAGQIKVENIAFDTYIVTETVAPAGYAIDDDPDRSVTVSAGNPNAVIGSQGVDDPGNTDQSDFHNRLGSLAWEKRTDVSPFPLQGGATFEVNFDDASGFATITVVDNGLNDANAAAGQILVSSQPLAAARMRVARRGSRFA